MVCIISGETEAGKSTVLRGVIAELQRAGYDCDGILTEKRGRFLAVKRISDGRDCLFAEKKRRAARPGRSRYDFFPEGAVFGNEALRQSSAAEILVIDEAGALELEGGGFDCLIPVIMERGAAPTLMVVRKKLLHRYKKRLNCQHTVFDVTVDSRDHIGAAIADCLKKMLTRNKPPSLPA